MLNNPSSLLGSSLMLILISAIVSVPVPVSVLVFLTQPKHDLCLRSIVDVHVNNAATSNIMV